MDILSDKAFIKINRSILEWEWYKNINTKVLFLHMLLKANWKDGRFEGKLVKRGSFVSSINKLSVENSLTEREVRTAISHLKSSGEVTSEPSNKNTVFTVVKYDFYQSIDIQMTSDGQAKDEQETNERHSNDILTTTIEEVKKGRREEGKDKKKDVEYHFQEIVDYLNTKAGTNYRGSSGDTKKYIKARFAEGYSLEDFKTVIDKKVAEWGNEPKDGDKDMRQYLRPSTLFSSKFESYLNQQPVKILKNKRNSLNQFPQNDYDFETLEKELIKN